MKRFALITLTAAASPALAQPTIDWYTIDGGGGTSTGGTYTLSGTIGQPDAGVMSGGTYTLSGGFWVGASTPAPPCDPDLNQDGNVDQDDVLYLINVIGGGDNPSGIDPDFNLDGNADQDDVLALINAIGGGGCP
ncbi:MAG: hypothetical protein IT433_06860 [Phycisphaerales bacterium]|nr:hypothetical protein [Phycisphaerales bacterium]